MSRKVKSNKSTNQNLLWVRGAGRRLEQLQAATAAAAAERNPHKGEAAQLSALAQEASAKLAAVEGRRGDLGHQVSTLAELDAGFGRTGVQSYALEGILGELQVGSSTYKHRAASCCFSPGQKESYDIFASSYISHLSRYRVL